jgi:hypothetical protein
VTADAMNNHPTSSTVDSDFLRWRRWVPKALLVIFCACIALSTFAIWSRNQIDDTDRYVRTVAPLADDPAIQDAIVVTVTNRFSSLVDDAMTRASLPSALDYLAAPITADLVDYVGDMTRDIVTSDQFSQYWEEANRAVHPTVSAILTGNDTNNMTTSGGKVTLDLSPLVQEVKNRLSQRGVNIFDSLPTDRFNTTVVLFDSPELADVQSSIDMLVTLSIVLPILGLISLGGYLWLTPNRRLGIIWAGLGLAATMTLILLILTVVRDLYLDGIASTVNQEAAAAFIDTIGRYFRNGVKVLGLVGLLTAGVAFVTRPGSWLRLGPEAIKRQLSTGWQYLEARWTRLDLPGTLTQHYLAGILALLIAFAGIAIIGLDRSTLGWGLTLLLIAAAGLVIVKLLAVSPTTVQPVPAAVGISGGMVEPARPSSGGSAPAVVFAASVPRDVQPAPDEATHVALIEVARDLSEDDLKVLQRFAIILRDTDRSTATTQQ